MMTSGLTWVQEMMKSDDKVGGWLKKGQNHDDVILEWSLMAVGSFFFSAAPTAQNSPELHFRFIIFFYPIVSAKFSGPN